jgi:hypothetical protein
MPCKKSRMCDKCQQLESTIQHYRRLLSHFFDDPVTVERVNNLIRDLQQRKEAMHC